MHGAAKVSYAAAEAHLAAVATDVALPSVEDVTERWETLTLAAQRAVIGRLIERIDVAPVGGGYTGFNPARWASRSGEPDPPDEKRGVNGRS